MSDRVSLVEELERRRRGEGAHTGREETAGTGAARTVADEEGEENFPAFGAYRGVRERALHLEFQRLQGSWPALGYAWLVTAEWAPSGLEKGRGQAIVLRYANGHTVTLRGRNLRRLHELILRQQAYRISEMGENADQFMPEGETVVYDIAVEEPTG